MKHIIRFYYWIILLWIVLVLVFFKFYNNFYFQNNESIIFLLLLLIVPIVLTIIKKVVHKINMNYFLKIKNNYYELLEKEIHSSLIKDLQTITNLNIVGNHLYFGKDYQGIIVYNETFVEIKIVNTVVSFKYYYGKTLEELALFDRVGFENKDPKVLCTEIFLLVKSIINKELIYEELRKGKRILASKLTINDILKYVYQAKSKKNFQKYNHKRKIFL